MRGIKLSHGVAFVEQNGVTVRINADGTCELSPMLLMSLEWDLRCEPPHTWDYLTESDIEALGTDVRQQIEQIVARTQRILGL